MNAAEPILRSVCWMASRLFYGSGLQADWIYEKMHRPSTYLHEAGNIGYFFLHRPRIHRLISLVLEPVYGCNLRCSYCWGNFGPRFHDQRERFMPWELFRKAVDQAPPTVETVSLGFLGETLLHPRLPDMIDYIADHGFRATLFSNCTLLTGDVLLRLARSRLAVLNVSVEPDPETTLKFRGADLEEIYRNVRRFAELKRPETEIKLSLVAHPGNVDRLWCRWEKWRPLIRHVKISPIITTDGERPTLTCLEPWRGSLSVLTSGEVSPCCLDIYSGVIVGNLHQESLPNIIAGPRLRDTLACFISGNLPETCRQCQEFKAPRVPRRVPLKRD